jgi:hypothetical protein
MEGTERRESERFRELWLMLELQSPYQMSVDLSE